MSDQPRDLTALLAEIHAGNPLAWEDLVARVHGELKALAHREMDHERLGHVLQTTALVNEAYIRLVRDENERFQNRAHFFTAAATAMRRVLVDEARRRKAAKRGQGLVALRVSQAEDWDLSEGRDVDPLEDVEVVHCALERLESHARHKVKGKIVELRFFAGLTIEQTAETLGVSVTTAKRDWNFARAWLRREIERLQHGP